ncbi:lytic transglycosylase domain-containing protein [Acetobacter sp. AN02]|uniref:lytic transglycosylase domain-containing protein n=1 Tax=Acetobacter sp. AN02 TaxID=2894186 RepID=UPI002434184F|nr:lytic transglycosylase domain-containing protein [Acetobacter sp. AN02]MDG6093812.1 lytic transglycosylase domain-containing protein [Acetobacter sp. AN02]
MMTIRPPASSAAPVQDASARRSRSSRTLSASGWLASWSFSLARRHTRPATALIMLLGLAACGNSQPGGTRSEWGHGSYAPPGSASDPWGPYIQEASNRFSFPQSWIRAVIHQESGGHQYINGHLTTSGAGAMGLMQLMPATWYELAERFSLGDDPYDPHDNIIAGTGYLRQLYEQFGSPGFLAAYNAGPGRVEQYMEGLSTLPDETVNYVASIEPNLGPEQPGASDSSSSPVMMASSGSRQTRSAAAAAAVSAPVALASASSLTRTGDGCLRNADAAYDPSTPCLMDRDTPHEDPGDGMPQTQIASRTSGSDTLPPELASYVAPAPQSTSARPVVPYRGRGTVVASATPAATYRPAAYTVPTAAAAARPRYTQPSPGGSWAIQIGAFNSGAVARHQLASAHSVLRVLTGPDAIIPVPAPSGSLYRARMTGLSASAANSACQQLRQHSFACFTVPSART